MRTVLAAVILPLFLASFASAQDVLTCQEAMKKADELLKTQNVIDSPPNLLIMGTAVDTCTKALDELERGLLAPIAEFCEKRGRLLGSNFCSWRACELDGIRFLLSARTAKAGSRGNVNADSGKSLQERLAMAADPKSFGRIAASEFQKDGSEKSQILDTSINEITARIDSKALSLEEAREYFDMTMTAFFIGGYGISGGYVHQGNLEMPLYRSILDSQPAGIKARVYDLAQRLFPKK